MFLENEERTIEEQIDLKMKIKLLYEKKWKKLY